MAKASRLPSPFIRKAYLGPVAEPQAKVEPKSIEHPECTCNESEYLCEVHTLGGWITVNSRRNG